ncbi:MAG: M20/M25/M40 family metallo-hydrolase [Clostridia bacterium]|nr:M20/M25/M40 family metallo-hydrolase [Clostridia bacterium]
MKYIGLIFLIAVLGFLAVLVINAVRVKSTARRLGERRTFSSPEKQLEYAERLGRMIRCETVSHKDSYDDTEFRKLRNTVEELFPEIHKRCERLTFSQDCWVYILRGADPNRNIMLMSHHDVVGAEGEWKHPPFCGQVYDGALWGRGAVDTKTPLFAELQALEELLSEGYEPPCNVYIGSSHNEEIGGDGIPEALKYFEKEGITFETILDEGGAVIDPPLAGMNCKCAMLAVHEKGIHRLVFTAEEGTSHKGLTANINTPVARMSAFIAEVNKEKPFVTRLYPQVKAILTHLAPYTPFIFRLVLGNLWCFGGIIKNLMPKLNPQAGAMVGTSCTFHEIKGSYDDKKCVAKATLRYVDDKDFQKDLEEINRLAQKYNITVAEGENNEYHKPADMSKPQFAYTRDCIAEIFPHVASAAYILPAGTDARHLSDICDCVIRFAPITMNAQQFGSVHSENENIDVEVISEAIAFYKHYLKNYK